MNARRRMLTSRQLQMGALALEKQSAQLSQLPAIRQLRGRRRLTLTTYFAIGGELNPELVVSRLSHSLFSHMYVSVVIPTARGPSGWETQQVERLCGMSNRYPDVLLIPLVAFDCSGNRLGRGKGYYDRWLQQIRQKKPWAVAIGIGWDFQCTMLEPEAWDQPLDAVLTERRLVRCQ